MIFLLTASILIPYISAAQQPAYFILGEEQFRGIQIYDIIQDKELNYWLATNEGIYLYDHYRYEKIECDQAKSSSVFHFVMNSEGTIYCHNLNNQVFRIRDRKCALFYELKAAEVKPDISLSIANDKLIIGAGHIIELTKEGSVVSRYEVGKHSLGPAFTAAGKSILYHLSGSDSVLVYANGTVTKYRLHLAGGDLPATAVLEFFRISSRSYAIDLRSRSLFSFSQADLALSPLPAGKIFERGGAIRIYETGNEIWIAGTLPGVTTLTASLSGSHPYYEDYFISDVSRDNEGNYLLSTFDKGVLVIPDLKVPDVISAFRDDPVTALYADTTAGVLLGSSKGKLMSYSGEKLSLLSQEGTRPVEALYGSDLSDLVFFDDGRIRAYHKQSGKIIDIVEAPLKDVAFVSDKEFYLGINTGLLRVSRDGNGHFKKQVIGDVNYRVYSVVYHTAQQAVYTSTADGLFLLPALGEVKKIGYRNKDIFSEELLYGKGLVFAVTGSNGILIIDKDRVVGSIQPMVNGNLEKLKRITLYKNTIIGSSSNGLFQFDMQGRLLRSFHAAFGFTNKKVVNFTIRKDVLWVSHAGGVQRIDLEYRQGNRLRPLIRFDRIHMNDRELEVTKAGSFGSRQRKIRFDLSSPTLRNREAIRYHYKLEGYEPDWNVHPYEINQVTYNALAPGSYTLFARAENSGLFSTTISYPFTIAPPFYGQWWFIVSSAFLFLFLVFMLYRWQLKTEHKKSKQINELNASRLTAIQSQMNPHFIFNALNSIQDLILKGDVEHSYSYIATFSDLVRRTLNYSEKDFIEFEQEIALLELYLSLEKLRFKKDFSYHLDIQTSEDFLIPPMLIQPFIENALAHGLLHKQGEKKLSVSFALGEDLQCIIEDNGVGREKARVIKQRQRSGHESFSGKAIRSRFDILNNVLNGQYGYRYEDLYVHGVASGTRVILSIPVKHEF
jgi:hypothetical protein